MHRILICGVAALIAVANQIPVNTRADLISTRQATAQQLDLLILHGKLVDGSAKNPRKADVGIRGDRIAFVGDAVKARVVAARTIDATGLIVAPGFIDPHTHTLADLTNEQTKSNQAFLLQGVTTVITGNDGGSVLDVGELLAKWQQQ